MSTEDDKIGYKQPPKRTQFKSGKSGNPKGRPKRRPSIKADLADLLKEHVVVTENGQSKKISKQELLLRQLFARAVGGDTNSLKYLLTLYSSGLRTEEIQHGSIDQEAMSAEDESLIEHYLSNKGKS